jgi:NAD(P)-dependent dehydrogenase (short-subunit alcohol dehydrogenase family)
MGVCEGRVAVVTGGSRGIGRAAALRLAHEGADVALVARDVDGNRLGRSLAETVAEVQAVGVRALAIAADLTDPAFPRATVIEQAEAGLGPVDILVNNAAMSIFRNVVEWTPAKVRAMYEVNVMAPWELCTAVVPGMVERGRGWIVNISSGVGEPGNARPGGAAYGGTKAMFDQMTRCLALELDGTPVTANTVSPQAASRTEFVEQLVGRGAMQDEITEPLEVMAEAILALATAPPEARGIVARDLDLLDRLGRPVRTLDGTEVVGGYDVDDLPQRIAELSDAATRQQDLRGAWGTKWGQKGS